MNDNKGQGAMEYLMTYGWAILVVMIVGIVMWQLGIFNMGSTSITATGFSKIKPQLAGTGIDATTGIFTGAFTNGVGTSITITGATVNNTMNALVACDLGVPSGSVAAGENFQLISAALCPALTGTTGEVYNARVVITYTVKIGTATTTHTDTGSIRGPME